MSRSEVLVPVIGERMQERTLGVQQRVSMTNNVVVDHRVSMNDHMAMHDHRVVDDRMPHHLYMLMVVMGLREDGCAQEHRRYKS